MVTGGDLTSIGRSYSLQSSRVEDTGVVCSWLAANENSITSRNTTYLTQVDRLRL